jgi:AAA15 family ATPase/GTPase
VFNADGLTQTKKEEQENLVPVFQHSSPRGTAKFELEEESGGTQRLYGLIAPLLDVLKEGRVLFVDELDSSLHTLLVRRLVSMFHNSEMNKKGAQLIFTTHDTSLLDHTIFRRDQIWFTEKSSDQATTIYPLSDFSPRSREAWERGYLAGRYGAIPFFTRLPDMPTFEMSPEGHTGAPTSRLTSD